MKAHFAVLALAIILASSQSSAAPYLVRFSSDVGWADRVIATPDRNFVVIGSAESRELPNASQFGSGPYSSFITKVSPAGNRLATLIFSSDSYSGIANVVVDTAGAIVVLGSTSATNMVVVNAHLSTNTTGSFLWKIGAAGTNVLFATFFGSEWISSPSALAVDSAGDIYVAGRSVAGHPSTTYSFGPANRSGSIVLKYRNDGTELLASWFIADAVTSTLAIGSEGTIYVGGTTTGLHLPTINAIQEWPAGDVNDAFVCAIAPDGASLKFCTYLGGAQFDYVSNIVPQDDTIVVAGETYSLDFLDPSVQSTGWADREFVLRLGKSGALISTQLFGESSVSTTAGGVALHPSGKVLLAHSAWGYSSLNRPFIATLDQADKLRVFELSTDCASSRTIRSITASTEGKVAITGSDDRSSYAMIVDLEHAKPLVARIALGVSPVYTIPATPEIRWEINTMLTGFTSAVDVVRFYDRGILLGASTNLPASLEWTNIAPGSHRLSAVAVSGGREYTSCPLPIRYPSETRLPRSRRLSGVPVKVRGTTAGARWPPQLTGSSFHYVWYDWTAPADGVYFIRASNQNSFIWITVRTNSSDANVIEYSGLVKLRASGGAAYKIGIPDYSAYKRFALQIDEVAAPPNDDFVNAAPLEGESVDVEGTLRNASREVGEPHSQFYAAPPSVWYTWTPPDNRPYTLLAAGSPVPGGVGIYSGGSLGELVEAAVRYPGFPTLVQGMGGVPLSIAIYDYQGALLVGNFTLSIRPVNPPANDNFADRFTVSGFSVLTNGNALGATLEPEEEFAYYLQPTVWWSWTAPAAGVYSIAISNSSARLYLLKGENLADLTNRFPNGSASSRLVSPAAGETFQIAIAPNYPGQANYQLAINSVERPGNDEFTNAYSMTGSPAAIIGTTEFSSHGSLDPVDYLAEGYGTVWYRWVAPSNGIYRISSSSYGADVTVFAGAALDSLLRQEVSGQTVAFRGMQGAEFRFMVIGSSLDSTEFLLRVQSVPPVPNDDIAGALNIVGSDITFAAPFPNATREPNDPLGQRSLWWTWTAPESGTVVIAASTSPVIAIYTNVPPQVPFWSGYSRLVFSVEQGATYLIGAGDDYGASGTIRLYYAPRASNDNFTNALVISSLPYVATNDTSSATAEQGEPEHNGVPSHSLWWAWTAPADQSVLVKVNTSDFSAVAAIYTGSTLTNLQKVGGGFGVTSLRVHAGIRYWVAADGVGSLNAGNLQLSISTVPTPVNDDFTNAVAVTNGHIAGTLVGASQEPDEFPYVTDDVTVWYKWTAPSNGLCQLSNLVNAWVDVYVGDSLTNLERIDLEIIGQLNPFPWYTMRYFQAHAGTNYLFRVSDAPYGEYGFDIGLRYMPSPVNDDFAKRTSITGAYVVSTNDNTFATSEPGEPFDVLRSHSLWWEWTAPTSGVYSVGIESSLYVLPYVFVGDSLANLAPAGIRDWGILLRAVAGRKYVIAVASSTDWTFNLGKLVLQIAPATPPENDDFANASALSGPNVFTFGWNSSATPEPGEPISDGNHVLGRSVWYSWTPGTAGLATVTVSNDYSNSFAIGAFAGDSVTNLSVVATNSNYSSPLQFGVQADKTYFIYVGGIEDTVGQFSLIASVTLLLPAPAAHAPRLLSIAKPSGTAVLESSTDLVHWMPIQTNRDAATHVLVPVDSDPKRFFRVRGR